MRILVVEDDAKIASAVRRGLESEGFTVEVADNGDDGWWMATEGNFDVIVLDIMLPGRNGFVLCRDLRAADNWVPILMLTAKDGELDEAEGLDTGADDYLTKPFAFPVLLARVRSLVRRAARRDPVPQLTGLLSVDSIARRVFVDGVEVTVDGSLLSGGRKSSESSTSGVIRTRGTLVPRSERGERASAPHRSVLDAVG